MLEKPTHIHSIFPIACTRLYMSMLKGIQLRVSVVMMPISNERGEMVVGTLQLQHSVIYAVLFIHVYRHVHLRGIEIRGAN